MGHPKGSKNVMRAPKEKEALILERRKAGRGGPPFREGPRKAHEAHRTHGAAWINCWLQDKLYPDFGLYRSENPERCLRDFARCWNGPRLFWCLNYKTPTQRRAESGL